jgi:proteasome assembly chaperone (PAC2) family protein
MTYEEFINMLEEPIGIRQNLRTETANLTLFCYELSLKVEILEKENEELKTRLVKLEDMVVREVYESKQFRRNVEPDLRYME